MDTWTNPDDVIRMWVGDNPPTDVELVGRWVARAERLIRKEFPDMRERLEDTAREPDLAESVKDVVIAMVTRVFRNPEGIRTIQDSTGGVFSGSTTFAGSNPGALYLEEWERAQLRPPGKAGRGQAFSISVGGNPASAHLPWCTLHMGGTVCSCGAILAGHPIYEGG